jgi:hypothetical protein
METNARRTAAYVARLVMATGALVACHSALAADAAVTSSKPRVEGWNELVDGMRDLPDRLLSKLPVSMQNNPQVRQEIGRFALAAFASQAIDTLGSDGDYPVFLAQIGQVLNVGQPNADTSYRIARLTPGGSYRLRGQRGSLRMANISQSGAMPYESGPKPARPGAVRRMHDINALQVDELGRFDVLLSPTRPADYEGDWWQLEPTTTRLLLRMVSADWSKERDPTISIERVDKPMTHTRRSAADLEQRLRQLPTATAFIASLFIDHVAQLRAQGFVNKLKVFDVAALGGLAGQFYYEGAYEIRDDEALILEAQVPKQCVYRSMILTNDLYETTDWYNNQSSLNDAQAAPDSDGVLRIVVSAKDPGVPNWLDTAGYPTGVVQGRWFQCDTEPVPSVLKVAMADLRKALPKDAKTVTPEERERVVRERRAAYQERPLW